MSGATFTSGGYLRSLPHRTSPMTTRGYHRLVVDHDLRATYTDGLPGR
jgi:hypothetical protein